MSPSRSATTITNNIDEHTPLLNDVEDPKAIKAKVTPVPKTQLGVISAIRVTEPIIFSQIFPYINNFLSDLNVVEDPKRIGFYSGLVESSFAIAQLLPIYNFAKLSDRHGRKPVILFGIIGAGITTILFGLSRSLKFMLMVRVLAGLCAGTTPVMHSVIAELSDSTNQAIVLPLYGLTWPIGSIIGPLLGGTLEHAATKYPRVFGYKILQDNPYFLPCLIAGSLACLAALGGFFFLEETLPSKRPVKMARSSSVDSTMSTTSTLCGDATQKPSEPLGMIALVSDPVLRAVCTTGFALAFIAGGFDALFVLFCYTSIQDGGLSLPASQISYCLSGSGLIAVIFQLTLMPYLLRTYNMAKLYRFCMSLYPVVFLLLPTLNLIAWSGFDTASNTIDPVTNGMLWIGIAVILVLVRFGLISFSISMILTKESSPNAASLGSANGLVQFSMCLARSISPAFCSSVFAVSIDHNLMGGYLWAVIIAFIGVWGARQTNTIIRAKSNRV